MSASSEIIRKPRILCLHGFRTSGEILSRQMSSFTYHCGIECHFIDGPFIATGPPDRGIQTFYPNTKYYEWGSTASALAESVLMIITYLKQHGPFDGILGFSQGAAMATRVAHACLQHPQDQDQDDSDSRFGSSAKLFHFVILIGGVPPIELQTNSSFQKLRDPNLHIYGTTDHVAERSIRLYEDFYDEVEPGSKTILKHSEDHRIPSYQTNIYPHVKDWIYDTTRQYTSAI